MIFNQYLFLFGLLSTQYFLLTLLRVLNGWWNHPGKHSDQNVGCMSPARPPLYEIPRNTDLKMLFSPKFEHFLPIFDSMLISKWTGSVNLLIKSFRNTFRSKWGVCQPSTTSRSRDIMYNLPDSYKKQCKISFLSLVGFFFQDLGEWLVLNVITQPPSHVPPGSGAWFWLWPFITPR